MDEDLGRRFLTTRELAALLRLKERKVYELAASGAVPCSRATGKLLFPRTGVEAWLARHGAGSGVASEGTSRTTARDAPGARGARPAVVAGSHDPLLDWALRESGAALATLFDGSRDGLERFARGEALAAGLHLPGERVASAAASAEGAGAPEVDRRRTRTPAVETGGDVREADPDALWNVPAVRERVGAEPVVLVEFARRERGVVHGAGVDAVAGIADLAGRRVVPRQPGAGGQLLLECLLEAAGTPPDAVDWSAPARTESDAVQAVADGEAELAFGLVALARRAGLACVPTVTERFDLLVARRDWFEPPWQRFVAFCRGEAFGAKAEALGGYDVSGFGRVRFNGGG